MASKINVVSFVLLSYFLNLKSYVASRKYTADWEDLDSRPAPQWYDRAKIGIFVHWGVYSVPGFNSAEWMWRDWKLNPGNYEDLMRAYPREFTYQEFAPMFKAELFEPEEFANLFAKAGAKYVVLTAKHHDGYTLFPSKNSFNWNSVDIGPHRDLVGELAKAVRLQNMKFGVYYSLYEWFHPLFLEDKKANFTTSRFIDKKVIPEIVQLVTDYKPAILWSDGNWAANHTYWKSPQILAWLYSDSPVKDAIVVNDRWGADTKGLHGDFYNYNDRHNPGYLDTHKWENALTLDSCCWGYRKNIKLSDVLSITKLINEVIVTVSCGGNILINVGPTKEGTIIAIFQERLLQLGEWLKINGDAIYNTTPWFFQKDSINYNVWYTAFKNPLNKNASFVCALFVKWPEENKLIMKDITQYANNHLIKVKLLGYEGKLLDFHVQENGFTVVNLPDLSVMESKYAWALKFGASD